MKLHQRRPQIFFVRFILLIHNAVHDDGDDGDEGNDDNDDDDNYECFFEQSVALKVVNRITLMYESKDRMCQR